MTDLARLAGLAKESPARDREAALMKAPLAVGVR